MSDKEDGATAIDDSGNEVNEPSRPKTVSLTKQRQENESLEEDFSIGEAFFQKPQNDVNIGNDNNDAPEAQATNHTDSQDENTQHSTENGINSPKLRPKTVTKQRTDGYQQRLVQIGAVGSELSKDQTPSLSPKPKSEKCYICGKEFLVSSLKIHEKQCAKKHEKETSKKENKTSPVSKVSKKPQLEACYLCGKEFFVHSLEIHETQCIKNWKANKTPDANDETVSERTVLEKNVGKSVKDSDESKVDVSLENDQSTTKVAKASPKLVKKTGSPGLKQKGLRTVPCYVCGVAFLPHSLKIHEKKCRAQDTKDCSIVEKLDEELNLGADVSTEETPEGFQDETDDTKPKNSTDTYIPKKPKTIVCYICGQEFLQSSYAFHEKKCAIMNESVTAEEPPLELNAKVNNTPRNSAKPSTIICYICGEEFLKSSYAFHEKKCAKTAENFQEKEPTPETTKPIRNNPKAFARPKTIICYICGEEFLKSSYGFHEKKCGKTAENFQEKEPTPETTKPIQSSPKTSPKPRTIVCYICGQEFLKSSYTFHEKQCANKNKKVEESQNEKTVASKLSTNTGKGKPSSDFERPQTPRKKPKTKTCYICGKDMLLSSLRVHEQQCQKKSDILKNINQQKSPAAQKPRAGRQAGAAKPKPEVCYICGESFLSSSIKVHEAQCEKRWNVKT